MIKILRKSPAISLLPMAVRPIPPFTIQPILSHMMRKVVKDKPSLFHRIGHHKCKSFLIDPTNMGFVLVLKPNPEHASLRVYRRRKAPLCDAKISGSFLTLFKLFDGQEDGDSLFFTRQLSIEGDTEAIVCLRNAIDDQDENITEFIAKLFGRIGLKSLSAIRQLAQSQNKVY